MATTIQIRGDHGGNTRRTVVRRALLRSLSVISPFMVLVLWELLARGGVLDVRFFPPPTSIADTLVTSLVSGDLLKQLGISLSRIGVGYVIGAVPAILLGLAMGLSPVIRAVIQPVVSAIYPVPKLAILPLFILLLGLGEASKIAVIAVGVFFQVLINTVAGVLNIDKIYIDVARNLGAGRLIFYRTVALPGALPVIFAGLQVAMGTAFLLIVAAEFVGANAGVGYLIWNSWQVFRLDIMYSGLILIALSGLTAAALLRWVERRLVPWKPSHGMGGGGAGGA